MSYYVIADDTGQVLEVYDSQPDPQEQADLFECSIYIIDGQHSGLTAEYTPPPSDDAKTG